MFLVAILRASTTGWLPRLDGTPTTAASAAMPSRGSPTRVCGVRWVPLDMDVREAVVICTGRSERLFLTAELFRRVLVVEGAKSPSWPSDVFTFDFAL